MPSQSKTAEAGNWVERELMVADSNAPWACQQELLRGPAAGAAAADDDGPAVAVDGDGAAVAVDDGAAGADMLGVAAVGADRAYVASVAASDVVDDAAERDCTDHHEA